MVNVIKIKGNLITGGYDLTNLDVRGVCFILLDDAFYIKKDSLITLGPFISKNNINELLEGKVNTIDIYNALDSVDAGKVLDARQGKILKDLIDSLEITINSKEPANANIQQHIASPHVQQSDVNTAQTNAEIYADGLIASLKGASPLTLDTLEEISLALQNNPAVVQEMLTALGNRLRVDIATQGLSTTEKNNALANLGLVVADLLNRGNHTGTQVISTITGLIDALNGKEPANANIQDHINSAHAPSDANNYVHPANHPPSIITQDASNRFVTDTEKGVWNGKQDTLGFTPENVVNKSQDIENDKASTTKYASVKQLWDWAVGRFQAVLVSGTNIRTINGQTLLGSTDIVIGSSTLEIVTAAGTTYTFLLTDAQKKILFTSATAVSATIPTNAVTAIPIGSKIEVTQSGAGVVTLVTTGLTITSATLAPIVLVQGQTVYLVKTAINSWTIDLNVELSGSQTISGLKTFLQDTLGLRNAANTFTSIFRNANTAIRIYTLPNKDGTVAMTSDIIAQLNGTINNLVKFGTATTGVNSSVREVGTQLLINNSEAFPNSSYNVSLGFDADKVISIEDSDNTIEGRNLTIKAGKAINFTKSNSFISSVKNGSIYMHIDKVTGDIYYVSGNFINKIIFNNDTFTTSVNSNISSPQSISINYTTKDVWVIALAPAGNPPRISKQTAGSGLFVEQAVSGISNYVSSSSNFAVCSIFVNPVNSDIFVGMPGTGGGFYKQTGGVGAFSKITGAPDTLQPTRIMCNPLNNDVIICHLVGSTGFLLKQSGGIGAFNQILTLGGGAGSVPNLFSFDIEYSTGTIYTTSGGLLSGFDIIYKQTNGSGSFIIQTTTNSPIAYNYQTPPSIFINHLGNVLYFSDKMYIQTNYAIGTANLKGGALKLKAGTGKGTGQSRIEFITGAKLGSGTDMQLETLREYITENGHHVYIFMPVFADNASALAGGLIVGTQYRTSTGLLMIVF